MIREGKIRPHHFRGVATIVSKLFNAIQPDVAFFGQKDIQQCVVIKNLIRDLLFPIEMEVVETMRESDGLAMSSRNRYLDSEQRQRAPMLYKAMCLIKNAVENDQVKDAEALIKMAKAYLEQENQVSLEYLSIADPMNLQELQTIHGPAILSGALRVGKTRIIDNLLLNLKLKEFNKF